MTKIKLLSAGLIAAAMLATPAMARENYVAKRHVQEANGENINLAKYPNQDALNGGALTPAGRMGLELPDGAAPVFMGQTMPMRKWAALVPHSEPGANRSYDHARDSFLGYDGRRHASR